MHSNESFRWSGPLLADTRPGELAEAFQPSLLSGVTTLSFKLHFTHFLAKSFPGRWDESGLETRQQSGQHVLPLGYHFLYQTKRSSQQCSVKVCTNCNDGASTAKLCSPGKIKRPSCWQGKTPITFCHVLQHAQSITVRLSLTLGLLDYHFQTVRGLPETLSGARFPHVFIGDFQSEQLADCLWTVQDY